MSRFTENTFENFSLPLVESAEELTLFLYNRLRALSNRVIRDPDDIAGQEELNRAEARFIVFQREAEEWTDEELPTAYLRGVEAGNAGGRLAGATAIAGAFAATPLNPDVAPMAISPRAAEILSNYPEHHTIYSTFQRAAYTDFDNMRTPIIRQHSDRIREINILAGESSYREATQFTRREMSQELMNRFSNEGVTGVMYRDGRTMSIEGYSEMVARSQTGNASRVAHMNRSQEYGLDLVQISSHFPTSNLCEPWQGRVYSISGNSDQYPPLDDAIAGGLYHPNCLHFESSYIPGTSELPDKEMSRTENREKYEAKQRQRYNERQTRAWKRREASAVDPQERERAKSKVKEWQARSRENVEQNDFLRRRYDREQI